MVVLAGSGLAMGRYEVTVGEYRAFASAQAPQDARSVTRLRGFTRLRGR